MNTRPDREIKIETEEPQELSWEDIESEVRAELDAAIKFQKEVIAPSRMENWDRYYGRPLGNEIKGRSQYMSRDMLETIEWILPNLIHLFTAADFKFKVKIFSEYQGQDMTLTPLQLGQAIMKQIYTDLSTDEEAGLFTVFYTWFKDALVSGSAFTKLFWEDDFTLEEFTSIVDEMGLDELAATPEITIKQSRLLPTGQIEVQGEFERISKDQLVCANVPHWEFVFEEHTKSINDDTGKGIVTVVTVDYLRRINKALSTEEEPYFFNLEVVEGLGTDYTSIHNVDDEMKRYYDWEVLNDYVGAEAKGPKKRVQFTEWHTRLDINNDGFLEDIKVFVANGVMVRWEINPVNFIPFSKLSPIIDCYHFQGIAYADLIIELQNLKTVLMRKMLDNFDLTNSGRWFVKPGVDLDVKRFLENIPGDVFRADPEKVSNMAPRGFDRSNLSLLEYVETIKENRTGSTRYNQGTDAGTLNQTAHGVQTIMTASLKRIELIGRLFAEGGLKDFFKKAILLYQDNLKAPFVVEVDGTDVQISPEMIQGRIEILTDMGTEAQAGQAESQRLLQLSAVLMDLNSKYPGIITPEKARSLAAKFTSTMGYEATTYVSSTQEFQQAQQKQEEIRQQMQDMQMQLERAKMQLEKEGVAVDKISALGDLALGQEKIKASILMKNAEIEQRRIESSTNLKKDLFKEIFQTASQIPLSGAAMRPQDS